MRLPSLPLLCSLPGTLNAHADSPQVAADLPCSPFRWSALGEHARAAIKLPLQIDGTLHEFQLDTGAFHSVIGSEDDWADAWLSTDGKSATLHDVQVGGNSLPTLQVFKHPSKSHEATLGLSALLGKRVVIDYPGERFCLIDERHWPAGLDEAIEWLPLTLDDGHLYLSLSAAGQTLPKVMFDTGSSLFPLVVDANLWHQLTGLRDPEQASQRIDGHAWGKPISVFGAPLRGALELGSTKYDAPMVYFQKERNLGESYPGVQGITGNALVWDSPVVLRLAGGAPALGILRTPQ